MRCTAILLGGFIVVSGAVHAAGRIGHDVAPIDKFEFGYVALPERVLVSDFSISPDRRPSRFYFVQHGQCEVVVRERGKFHNDAPSADRAAMGVIPNKIRESLSWGVGRHSQTHIGFKLVSGGLTAIPNCDHHFNGLGYGESPDTTLDGKEVRPQLALRSLLGMIECGSSGVRRAIGGSDRRLHVAGLSSSAFAQQPKLFLTSSPELIGGQPEADGRDSQNNGKRGDDGLVVVVMLDPMVSAVKSQERPGKEGGAILMVIVIGGQLIP